jgi:hypothetical protein
MRPVKILFLAANPTDQAPLRTDDERRRLDVEIITSGRSGLVKLAYEPGIRREELIEALRKHRPDIVHFAGHGSDKDAIVLEASDGTSRAMDTKSVAELFRLQGKTVKLVLLNACYSRAQAKAIVEYVPVAIGMNQAIPDEMALSFASTFYQGLVQGESIQNAFESSLFQIGSVRAGEDDEHSRDLKGRVSPPRVIPELIHNPECDPTSARLVGGDPGDEPSSENLPRPVEPSRKAEQQHQRAARRSVGLPVDRGLGNALGLLLLSLAAAYLLLCLLAALGAIDPMVFLPGWLWIPAILVVFPSILLLSPWPYRRSRLLQPDRLRLHKNNPAHFYGREEDLECILQCCRNHSQTNLVGESGSGRV